MYVYITPTKHLYNVTTNQNNIMILEKQLKEKLNSQNIPFREVSISANIDYKKDVSKDDKKKGEEIKDLFLKGNEENNEGVNGEETQ